LPPGPASATATTTTTTTTTSAAAAAAAESAFATDADSQPGSGTESVEDVIRKHVILAEFTNLCVDAQPSAIATPGEMMWALQDPARTAWVYEAEFRVLGAASQHEYLATVGVMNCITVAASSAVTNTCFMAHVNPPSILSSTQEQHARSPAEPVRVLGAMCDTLRDLFADHAMSDVRVSLIGGWTEADMLPMLKQLNPAHAEACWNFSSVVHGAVQDALPNALVDCAQLNRFPGVSWCNRTRSNKLTAIIRGHAFRAVVLCKATGQVGLQTTDISDLREGGRVQGCPVPAHALLEGMQRLHHMNERIQSFVAAMDTGGATEAVMTHVGLEGAPPCT